MPMAINRNAAILAAVWRASRPQKRFHFVALVGRLRRELPACGLRLMLVPGRRPFH